MAHREIDLANPKTNRKSAGFTDEEREGLSNLLAEGFLDTFRHLYPEKTGAYSWWSYRAGARKRNVGWRIDYFIASDNLATSVREATIHSQVEGSDHCPVGLSLSLGNHRFKIIVQDSTKEFFLKKRLGSRGMVGATRIPILWLGQLLLKRKSRLQKDITVKLGSTRRGRSF